MSAPTKQWGVTGPISSAMPTAADVAVNVALLEELKAQNNFETPEGNKKRGEVLTSLQEITEEFVKRVCRKKGLPEHFVEQAGGKIFTSGSYRLGAYGPGSDIDTLVVTPKQVTRADFYDMYPEILLEMAPSGSIEKLTPVPQAFVPIIKFEYFGVSIDLIFAWLEINSVSRDQKLNDKNLLRGLDEPCLKSVNGPRVTDEILDLVPEPKVFRLALRAIKLWAQRRAIYANIVGFPGGVAWAMLVARICQFYPHAISSTIVDKFFSILQRWEWPNPILLKQIEDGPLQTRIWNPRIYGGDRGHLMPIITPAYPSMCSTHNITHSTKKIIMQELKRGGDITSKIITKKREWKDLFTKHTFFTNGYKYYLCIIAGSRSKEAQLKWSGTVESKIRSLVSDIETVESVEVAHPFNKGTSRVYHCKSEEEMDKVFDGEIVTEKDGVAAEKTELPSQPIADGLPDPLDTVPGASEESTYGEKPANGEDAVEDEPTAAPPSLEAYTTTFYIGIEPRIKEGARTMDIAYQTREFKRKCQSWEQFNEGIHYVAIKHTRNYDLPSDLFGPSETRPERKRKRGHSPSGRKGDQVKKASVVQGVSINGAVAA